MQTSADGVVRTPGGFSASYFGALEFWGPSESVGASVILPRCQALCVNGKS